MLGSIRHNEYAQVCFVSLDHGCVQVDSMICL